jgi:hypothetical protein
LDTRERAKETSRFVILIPHRDAGTILDKFRARLFAAGYPGAYSFPPAAALAMTSRPFSRDELKALAGNIRSLTRERDGKILCAGTAFVPCPQGVGAKEEEISGAAAKPKSFPFFGALLSFPLKESLFPHTAKGKIIEIPSSAALCAATVRPGEIPVYIDAPELSFRAAYIANLAMRPLGSGENGYSFEWRIGPPVWLPM